MTAAPPDPILAVRDLRTRFRLEGGSRRDQRWANAVDGVSFSLAPGRTLALVGESGCGKSVTALSLLRLVAPPGEITGGEVRFAERDLLALDERELRRVRGGEIAMVFQEPMTSLNPVLTIGRQVAEVVETHRGRSARAARIEAAALLARVGIPDPERRLDEYPHRLSGGMRQRVMIAMALAGEPRILIADEPTTALDVTVQAQILDLLRAVQQETGMAILLITHDLGVVAQMADDVAVMYAARVVEEASARDLFANPMHPYTRGLFAALPRFDSSALPRPIPGSVPDPTAHPAGCVFHPRCSERVDRCARVVPALAASGRHRVACDVVRGETDS